MQNMSDQTTQWQMTSVVGNHVLPTMKILAEKLPHLKGAMLCTTDGFNICSLGLDMLHVGKIASLSSSIFSLGKSVLDTLTKDIDDIPNATSTLEKKELLLTVNKLQVFIVEVAHPTLKNLVLLVAVDQTNMGATLVIVRNVVQLLENKFSHPILQPN